MTMANAVSSLDVVQMGVLSLVYNSKTGTLFLYSNYNPATGVINSFELPLAGKKLSDYGKINFNIMVNGEEKYARILIVMDDMTHVLDLSSNSLPGEISLVSLVWNHPALNDLSFNFERPSLDTLFKTNIFATANSAGLCALGNDKNCDKCIISDLSLTSYCTMCKSKYKFINSVCSPELNVK